MMDDFCIWLERLLHWVDREGMPAVPWIGQAGGRLNNPPAPHLEFIYVLQGGFTDVRIGDRHLSLPRGRLSLHNVHQGNRSTPPCESSLVWCCFFDVAGVPEFESLSREALFTSVPVNDGAQLGHAFAQLQSACAVALGPGGGYLGGTWAYTPRRAEALTLGQRMTIKSACMNLLAAMLREGEQDRAPTPRLPDPVRRAMTHLSLHARDPRLRLEDAATEAGLSMDHFGRLFRAALGMSPMRYLQAVRIERSRFLLRHTQLTVAEIAREVGFRDPYYFSRVFRRSMGVSPRTYRQDAAAGASTGTTKDAAGDAY